jgi:glycosyltransferase involved in cell wall biosynthesis
MCTQFQPFVQPYENNQLSKFHDSSMLQKPHICFVAPNIWPVFSGDPNIAVAGGAEVQQSILARLLVREGYQVSIVCEDYGQPKRSVRDGVTVIKTFRPRAGLPMLRFIYPRLTTTWSAMRMADADIYYQRSAGMLTAVVAEFCRRHGKQAIYAAASDSDFIPEQQMIHYQRDRWLFRKGLAMVDAVIVQNEQQKHFCAENFAREATLIPSCYALPNSSKPIGRSYVLWVAVMRQLKRPEIFIEIARRLPHRQFVMVGGAADFNPEEQAYFESIRRAANELPNVEFTGFLPPKRAEACFDHACVLVNASSANNEGFPNVFLQAWARGIPTIAFSDAGARLHGEIVYPVVDSVEEAVNEIEQMFNNDLYHARTSSRCLEYFNENHGTKRVICEYQALLERLTSSKSIKNRVLN